MTPQEIEELKQLLELQREMTRQRLRTATCEAWVDDVQQKMGINRAVYAAGYGLAPAGKTETITSTTTNTTTAPPPAAPAPAPPAVAAATVSTAAKLAPYLLLAAGLAGGGGIAAAILQALTPAPAATPPAATAPATDFPVYDVQRWQPAP